MTQNITVLKTIRLMVAADQNMYPGFPPTCWGHYITFQGTGDVHDGQIWIKDISLGRFRQVTTGADFSSGTLFFNASMGLFGNQVLVISSPTTGQSNEFSCNCDYTQDILTPGTNLGPIPASFPWLVPQTPSTNPLPAPIVAKPHGHNH